MYAVLDFQWFALVRHMQEMTLNCVKHHEPVLFPPLQDINIFAEFRRILLCHNSPIQHTGVGEQALKIFVSEGHLHIGETIPVSRHSIEASSTEKVLFGTAYRPKLYFMTLLQDIADLFVHFPLLKSLTILRRFAVLYPYCWQGPNYFGE